jgi:hypothetical protein
MLRHYTQTLAPTIPADDEIVRASSNGRTVAKTTPLAVVRGQ